ncbi:hemolysin family protein [Dactylosporangium sp. NPDC048998]|uniref:hemolysin family protein n=1 Tax=Dactylosporangium sp. NPDC048998 TaxID=3363976 RepID=UPI00371B6194
MTELLVTILLLFGNAFFVAAEFSLIASRRTVIEPMAATSRRARTALRAMNEIPLMIAGAQLGVTICTLALGALAEPALAHGLRGPFEALSVPERLVHPVAFGLALGVVVFAHTVVGEMVPKNLTLASPERAVLWLGPPMYTFCMATRPVLVAMKWASRTILSLWRIEATGSVKTVFTAEELAGLAAQATTEGLLAPEEHARIAGALALSQRTARDALRPWAEITTIAEDVSPASLEVLATRTNRSRFPVVERASRRVLGFVHVKDVLGFVGPQRRAPIPPELIRPLGIVPPTRTLAELLLSMRRERQHIVLVSDGRIPLGVVTLDDVLTAVVGEPVAREPRPATQPA